ncbi:MAG TPA: HrpE/YscL family type III secretion apparatus protein [Defluviitoga tunisiensis]|nr:HrpE/YscL family type III secretion apparatus protein [Defluviitoga tunisiensis]MDY0380083.1 HrpE/YscL family type III secretion apparatus protein [Defluviitoga tunisiensis]HOB55406.1 HrpE/YscL family type III secretion apparatus protein [Defluviitoga tunisiensis]HOK16032.1 HrpE/YscL family type III secretion apparatus protein [Defluviitoga tunisiensis]HOL86215.1 HrpE/YscL family type III secretion apparatus protein [Defluviitoga tunisiensis]
MNKRIINNKYVVLDKTFEIETENTQVDKVGDIKKQEELLKSEIIKKAHKDSEKIIESARNEAAKILEKAKLDAQKIMQEQIESSNKKRKILEEDLKKVNEEMRRIANEYNIYVNELSNQARIFCEEVIKIVVGKYFEETVTFPDWIEKVFNDLQSKLYMFKDATLKVSPSFNKEFLSIIIKVFGDSFQIVEDASLSDNQIFLDTNQGIFDLSPQTFIKDLLNILEVALNEEGNF